MNNIEIARSSIKELDYGLVSILPNFALVSTRIISSSNKDSKQDEDRLNSDLYQQEISLTYKMSAKRFQDFRAGRLAAKDVLSQLKIKKFPLLIDANRAPLWPKNVIGSISHSRNICIVAAARNSAIAAIGIDIESKENLNADILPLICDDSEISHLTDLKNEGFEAPLYNAKLIFSIKESIFKCLNPLINSWIDFKEMRITLNPDNKTYSAVPNSNNNDLMKLGNITGNWYSNDYFHITSCWL